MFGKKPSVNPLELRKQLLIAESEINRAQLLQDGEIIIDGVRGVTNKARSFGSVASMAGMLAAGFFALRGRKTRSVEPKHSWWRTALKGAKAIVPLWFALRKKS